MNLRLIVSSLDIFSAAVRRKYDDRFLLKFQILFILSETLSDLWKNLLSL